MNKQKVITELVEKYPGKNIVCLPDNNPREIICELEPKLGMAVAVIDSSKPHKHNLVKEFYKVIKGELLINIDGKEQILKEGEYVEIKPPAAHFAKGNETWVDVFSDPSWHPEDHILTK